MSKNRTEDGRRNFSGIRIAVYRKALPGRVSQEKLAEMLQLEGLDCDKYTIKKIENGSRAVTDIELKIFAKFFHTTADELLHEK